MRHDTLAIVIEELSACRPLRDFSNVAPEDDLFDDLGLDSLDRETVTLALEERFGIDLPSIVAARWRTVGDVVSAVERALQEYPVHG